MCDPSHCALQQRTSQNDAAVHFGQNQSSMNYVWERNAGSKAARTQISK